MANITQIRGGLNDRQQVKELREVLEAVRTDLNTLRDAFNALVTKVNAEDVTNLDNDYAAAGALTLEE